jgi:glutathione peroxidase
MSIYDFKVTASDGSQVDLGDYKGQVLVIVNTASKCGFTPQFEGLEQIYQQHKDQGLTVIGFPCNQFRSQDPGSNEEILEFCQVNYGVTFPMMAKIDVNGDDADPV